MRSDITYNGPRRFAHTGVTQFAPENTPEAFRKAAELGFEGIELDIQISGDGEIIVTHNGDMGYMTFERHRNILREMTAEEIRQFDMNIRVSDYQMYLSGERFEAYQGVIGWFTSPISSLVSLIIPLMFVGVGFTSDWDVLYMDDVRIKCMVIGIAFDLAGYLLMVLPYIFFWNFTDEKHLEVMRVLQERADNTNAENTAVKGQSEESADAQIPVSAGTD